MKAGDAIRRNTAHSRWSFFLLLCLVPAFLFPSGAFAERYALIVGNNSYPNFSAEQQLSGCESDARMVREMLISRIGVPAGNVRTILGREATAEAILGSLKSTLGNSKPGDSILFYYSGHGAQITDENGDEKDDRLDEVLCPYDFKFLPGRRARNAIVDDQLDEILTTMAKDREFVAVFDCCHSGTGLRAMSIQPGRHVKYLHYTGDDDPSLAKSQENAEPLTRSLFRNTYVTPPPSDSGQSVSGFLRTRRLSEELEDKPAPKPGEQSTTGAASSGAKKAVAGTVLVAAARDYELAAENTIQVRRGAPPETHGALTLEMCRYIQESPDPQSITYRDLKNYLSHPIVQGNNTQNPEVEVSSSAMLDKEFLGGAKGVSVEPKETPVAIPEAEPTPKPTPEPTPMPEPTPTPKPAVVQPEPTPTPTPEPRPTPKPEPVVAPPPAPVSPAVIQAMDKETFPQPIAVAFKRCDAFATEQKPVTDLNAEASSSMLQELTVMVGNMRDVAVPVSGNESFGVLVVYGAQDKAAGRSYTAVVVDGNSAQVVKSTSGPTLREVLGDVEREVERNYLATNLMRIRQPIGNRMQLDLNIGGVTGASRGMQVTRRRFSVGEEVAFEARPSHNGYLTLINIDCTGRVSVLYPNSEMTENRDGFVRAGDIVNLPADGQYSFPVEEPVGKECVKAFLTPKPLSGLAQIIQASQSGAAGGAASRSLSLMRGISGELDRTIGVKSTPKKSTGQTQGVGGAQDGNAAGDGGKPEWSDFKTGNWAENTIVFTTSR